MVEWKIQLHAHNRSGFDTWKNLNNVTREQRTVDLNKTGEGSLLLKAFNEYIGEKSIPWYVFFGCGLTHSEYYMKKLGETFK